MNGKHITISCNFIERPAKMPYFARLAKQVDNYEAEFQNHMQGKLNSKLLQSKYMCLN